MEKQVKVSQEFIVTSARILGTISGQCDGARTRDNCGFNRSDLERGVLDLFDYLIVERPAKLNPATVKWILFMSVFYQRQWVKALPADTLSRVKAMQKAMRERGY